MKILYPNLKLLNTRFKMVEITQKSSVAAFPLWSLRKKKKKWFGKVTRKQRERYWCLHKR